MTLSPEDLAAIERIVHYWNAPAQFSTLPALEAIALHFKRTYYRDGVEDAAKACEDLCYGIDIKEWLNSTKKEVSARSCTECAAAIRRLISP